MADHPTKDELSGFVLGTLPPESTDLVAEHVEKCQPCQETVCQLDSHKDTLLDGLRRPAPPVDEACRKAVDKVVAFAKAGDKSVTSSQASPPSISTPAAESGPSREQFVSALRAVQIIDEADWARLQKESPAVAQAADGATLARALVAHGTLTKFQATALYQGKAKSLVFGEYILLDLLGSGGMGQVFKARHRSMDRVVALKVLAKTAVNSPEAVKRFQREVKAAAKLHHPNIVTAFDASRQDGVHYLVMEYVEGSDLSAVVKRDGPLPIEKAIDYIRQAARGLEYAHAEGVVHRDIKPANLLLDKKGVVKILDMGLARLDTDAAARDAGDGLTQTGQVMGTVDYMAPEQAFDTSRADGKADMYSLGCSLHRILTGQSMYVGETLIQKLLAHREHPVPSLRAVRAEVPAALDALYQRMVAKRPEDRPTMAEAAMELEALANPSPTETLLPSVVIDIAGKGATDKRPAAGAKSAAGLGSPEPTQPKPQAGGTGRKPPQKVLIAAAAAGAFALIAIGVWLLVRNEKGDIVAKVEAPPGTRIEVPSGGSVEVLPGPVPKPIATAGITAGRTPPAQQPPSFLTPNTAAPPPGDYALRFDGDSIVELKNLTTTNYPSEKDDITLEAYVTPEGLKVWSRIVGSERRAELKFEPRGANASWEFRHSAQGNFPRSPVTPNRRVHVAGVRRNNENFLFVDGKLVSHLPDAPLTSAINQRWSIGEQLVGIIDEVRISNTARYSQDFIPAARFETDDRTTALYHFDEGTGDVLRDASGNGADGKIVGAKWVRADGSSIDLKSQIANPASPPPADYALHFDGTSAHVLVPTLSLDDQREWTLEATATYDGPARELAREVFRLNGQRGIAVLNVGGKSDYFVKAILGLPDVGHRAEVSLRRIQRTRFAVTVRDQTVNLYIDGRRHLQVDNAVPRVAKTLLSGLLIGGAPAEYGGPSFHLGTIDEVRISKTVRYDGDYAPQDRLEADADTTALYHFDEGTGDVLRDASGHGHDGKIVGATWVRAEVSTIPQADVAANNALQFDATTSGIMRLPRLKYDGSHPLTLEAWVKPSEDPRALSNRYGMAHVVMNPLLQVNFNYRDRTWHLQSSTEKEKYFLSQSVPHTERPGPTHVAAVLVDGTLNLYLNGQRKLSQPLDAPIKHYVPTNDGFCIGDGPEDGAHRFHGLIDELRISRIVRYDRDFVPKTRFEPDADALALYHFDEGTGNRAADASTFARHIELQDHPWGVKPTWIRADGGPIPPSSAVAGAVVNPPKFTNALGMEFSLVPKGKAWLGGGGGKPGTKEFAVSRDFYLGTYEVTQGEWKKVMGDNQSRYSRAGLPKDKRESEAVKDVSDTDLERFPVEWVNGYGAMKFVNALNAATQESGWIYRLPTSDEWEYACRGGPMTGPAESGFDYYFDQPFLKALPGQLNSATPPALNRPSRVGSYAPNRLGLYDMHGNVAEWCNEVLPASPPSLNPRRLTRGGRWDHPIGNTTRASGVESPEQWYSMPVVGLRLARVRATTPAAAVTRPEPGGNYALYFDGVRSSVAIPSLSLALPEWTVEVTAAIDGPPRIGTIVRTLGDGLTAWIETGPAEDAKHSVQALTRTTTTLNTASHADVASGQRVRYAMVFRNGQIDLYHDGRHLAQTSSVPQKNVPTNGRSFTIGATDDNGVMTRLFQGTIDEVRVSKNARFDGDYQPQDRLDADPDTVALYHFDEGTGDLLRDASGNKHDGKIIGATWVRADGSATPATLPVAPSSGVVVVPRTPLPDGPPGQLPSIPVPENPRMVVVANDGRHVGFMGGPGHPIWLDLTTGKNVWRNTTGHPAYIRGSRLSPDGAQWALVGLAHDSQFAYVRILRTADGREEWNYLAEGPQFVGVAFSPDGKQLAVGNVAGEVRLFELPAGREVRRWQAHDTTVHAVAYSRDGLRLVTSAAATTIDATLTPTKQTTLKMWRVADGIEIPDFFRTTGRFSRVDAKVTRDGRFLLVGSPTDTALVWDMQTGENLALIRNETKGQRAAISETPSGTHALVGGDTMLIVEPATGRVLLEMRDAESRHIHDPIPTPDGRFVIAWGEKQLRIWRLPPECWAPGIAGTVPAAAAGTLATNRTLADPAFQQWLAATQKLPAEQQLAEFSKKLMELNPGFDGKLSGGYGQANPVIDKGVVTGVGFSTVKVNNISPVRLFTDLTDLRCNGEAVPNTGALTDLSPLQGLRLKTLSCGENRITDLSPLQGMPLLRLDAYANPLGDISALQGMPLTHLSLNNTSYVKDVSPLRGMPLRYFSANSLKATDLSPLAGLPLEGLTLRGAAATDLSPLKNCTALKTLELTRFRGSPDEITKLQQALPNCKIDWDDPATPAASAPNIGAPTKSATLADPAFQAWLKATQALPADKQLEAVSKKLMELNPGFDGKLLGGDGYKVPKIENGVVTGIGFITDQVTDISPVRAFPGLRDLYCRGSNSINGQSLGKLVDLSPLSGLPLQSISATYNPIQDLSPLSGMPLTSLDVAWAKVSDLSPLAGMPLEALGINGNQGIKDIRTLRGMPLKRLSMISKPVSDLSPLAGMQLESLSFASTQVADISVLRGMPLTWIDMGNTKVTDLSPLHDCKTLKSLSIKNQKIDPAEIAKLQQALPECKIEFSLPETTPAAAPSPATNGAWQQESDPDRRVARWVLARGGKVGVLVNGSARKDIARLEDLPAESFVVTNVYRPSGLLPITADEWSSLGELRFAQAIDLCGCKPTDDALAALARCPNLTYLVMAFSEPFGDEGLKHLSAATQLEYLDLGGCAMTAAGLEHLGKLTRLRSLKIQNTKQLQLTTLAPLLTLRNLEELELYATTATDAVVAELAALPRLRFLNLKNSRCSPEITDTLLKLRGLYAVSLEGLKLSAPGLRKLADHPTLTVVCVWGAGIAMEEYDRLVPELPKITLVHEQLAPKYADELAAYDWFKTVGDVGSGHYAPLRDSQAAFGLMTSVSVSQPVAPDDFRRLAALANVTSLVLTSNDTTDEHLRAAFAALRGRPHLTSLTLYGPKFTSAAALDDLAVHENLRSLHLGRSSLPTDEATAFVAKLPHLRSLRLESSGLTDGVFAHLAPLVELELLELTNAPKISGARLDVLRSMPNLRRLALNETGVNDAALAALPNLPVLEHLSLEKTAVTDAGLEHLAHCRRLRTIRLRSTQVTAQAVARLQAALPECFIVWDIAANVGKLQSAADSPEFQQ